MVKYKVVVTPRAQNSIRRIYDRLSMTASKDVAIKVRRGINDTIKKLKTFPKANEVEHRISDELVEYRRILKWDYRIIYQINEEKILVAVVEIVHNSQSDETIMKKFGK